MARQVVEEAFALARELSLEMTTHEMVEVFAATLERLMPGRLFCLRVVDPTTLRLSVLDVRGPLDDDARLALATAPLTFKRSAQKATRLSDAVTSTDRVRLAARDEPIFSGARPGFSVPLVASGHLFGLLDVDYPKPKRVKDEDEDEHHAILLANQLSLALYNAHLLGEARHYRDRLSQIIEVANALIVVAGVDGRIGVMNHAMQRYGGWPTPPIGEPVEILGSASVVIANREPDGASKGEATPGAGLAGVLRDGLSGVIHSDHETFVARPHGPPGRAVFNTSILRGADGRIDGVLGVGQDVARLRSLEHQIIQTEKLATLGQLAAGVVHELNNPLTAISVYSDYLVRLLERGEVHPTPTDLEKARKITEGAQRIQKLTRDLMTYARPGGDRELVDVGAAIRQAIGLCEHSIHWAEAEVVVELTDGLPPVRAIATQLHQVIINLVTNACHALPAPGETITVSAHVADSDVVIEVADTGVGIDELDQPHVFEPFFTTKREGKGTGLGLSICKNIVEGAGGRIAFRSQPGHGTVFRITLPAHETLQSRQESRGKL